MTNAILTHKVYLAPMAGITDAPMRRIVSQITEGKVGLVSEMVAVNALSYKNAKTYKIADVRDEPYPVVVQLMGGEPAYFETAAKLVTDLGASGIDINMGCPVRKIIASGGGSVLMQNIKKASQIIEITVKSTNLPVSVKFRAGFDAAHINAVEFAKMCEESGAKYVTVHGRTKAQGYSGLADWNIIGEVKANVGIPVIGNGDVTDENSAEKMIKETKADAVMIGRAALGNPWVLKRVCLAFEGKKAEPLSTLEIYETLKRHLLYLKDYYGPKVALGLSRKHVCWYLKSLYDAKKFRENYMKITDFDVALDNIDSYFQTQIARSC